MENYKIPPEAESQLPSNDSVVGKAARFLLGRYQIWPIVDHLINKTVPRYKHSYWYNLGGIILFFFAIQVITGILLMTYYRPAEPWSSVQRIVMEVPFGNIVRSVHHWGANLMVLTIFFQCQVEAEDTSETFH